MSVTRALGTFRICLPPGVIHSPADILAYLVYVRPVVALLRGPHWARLARRPTTGLAVPRNEPPGPIFSFIVQSKSGNVADSSEASSTDGGSITTNPVFRQTHQASFRSTVSDSEVEQGSVSIVPTMGPTKSLGRGGPRVS
jgi:hypothetical protein